MADVTLVLNDAPYGTEKLYNALRLAMELVKSNVKLNVFLMTDAVTCGVKSQTTPDGYYNIGRMLMFLVNKGVEIHACATCMDARGLTQEDYMDGVTRSSTRKLAEWTISSDKVIAW
jgi:uncharacterized protein involved in oxidation of intracellular sulfur